jgi:hypothetical protein
MSEIVKMIQDIKEYDELQQFANAQYNTLIAQSKKIHKLQEEIERLNIEFEKAKQATVVTSTLDTKNDQTNDAETICLIQLALLNRKSMEGELTLEETKKVETFSKVLLSLNPKQSEDDKNKEVMGEIDTKDLLSLITGSKA